MGFGGRLGGIGAGVLLGLAACSDDAGPAAPPPAPAIEAGVDAGVVLERDAAADVEAATAIVVRTSVPPSSLSPGGPANATWAAVRDGSGPWATLAASAPGTYSFGVHGARWAVAFACADDKNALVTIHERPVATASLDVALEEQCGSAPSPSYVLHGTFTHVPLASGWLDFAYALDARGAVIVTSGESAPYEIVNVVEGTWDIAFGLRDQAGTPLTKIAMLRGRALTGDALLDVDLETSAFVPGSKKLTLGGLSPEETVAAQIAYTTTAGGEGIDVGPQDVPNAPLVEVAYSTIPAAAQQASDRYRAAIVASGPDALATRGVRGTFHEAIDLSVELPAAMPEPSTTVAATAPWLRLSTIFSTRPGADVYEVLASARITQKSRRAWRMTLEASPANATALAIVMPDLSNVPGFDPAWAIPPELERRVTATVTEKSSPLGDGSSARFAASTVVVVP